MFHLTTREHHFTQCTFVFLPHQDTRSQLEKFYFTKPLMDHQELSNKSGGEACRRHSAGPDGDTRWCVLAVVRPQIHPPSPLACLPACLPTGRRAQKHREDRPHPSPHLFRGRSLGQRGGGDAHAEHTETSETHNSQHVPPLAALSLQPPMLPPHTPPSPSTTTAADPQASRDLHLTALQHIPSIPVPPSQQQLQTNRTQLIAKITT